MMLSEDFLTPRGDVAAMAERAISWLQDDLERQRQADWSRQRAREFPWDKVGQLTDRVYRDSIPGQSGSPA